MASDNPISIAISLEDNGSIDGKREVMCSDAQHNKSNMQPPMLFV